MRSATSSSRRYAPAGRSRSRARRPLFRLGAAWRDEHGQVLPFVATACVLALFILLGGGPTRPGIVFTIEFAASAMLLGLVLFHDGLTAIGRAPAVVRMAVALLCCLPIFQLLPLPPSLTQIGPGREMVGAIRELAGAGGRWQPITIAPSTTIQLLLALVMLATLFLAAVRSTTEQARLLILLVLGLEVLTVLVGALQITSGGRLFNFYESPHRFNLVGFFANRNHTAVFLACAVPLAVAMMRGTKPQAPRRLLIGTALVGLAVFVAALGTVSRTGLILVGVSMLLSVLLLVPLQGRRVWMIAGASTAGAAVLTALLLTTTIAARVFERYSDVSDDMRWTYYTNTAELVRRYLPWGGGFGSFIDIYAAHEPLAEVKPTYVNNAHNDYLEIALEAGVPGLIGVVLVIVAVIWCVVRLRRLPNSPDQTMALAGFIVVTLLLLHSMVDYPLRRMATAAIFAFAFALVVRPLLSAGRYHGHRLIDSE